jgi:hypothetical protein
MTNIYKATSAQGRWGAITFALPALAQTIDEVRQEAVKLIEEQARSEGFLGAEAQTHDLKGLLRSVPEALLERALGKSLKFDMCESPYLFDSVMHCEQVKALQEHLREASGEPGFAGTFEPTSCPALRATLGITVCDDLLHERKGDWLELVLTPRPGTALVWELLHRERATLDARMNLQSAESVLERVVNDASEGDKPEAAYLLCQEALTSHEFHDSASLFEQKFGVSVDFVLQNKDLLELLNHIYLQQEHMPTELERIRVQDAAQIAQTLADFARANGQHLQVMHESEARFMDVDLNAPPGAALEPELGQDSTPQDRPAVNAFGPEFR